MKLQDKIMNLRKMNGMSQEELAEKLDVSRQAVSRWEQGTVVPDSKNIVELSKLFKVTTDYLLIDEYESDEDLPTVKKVTKDNHILHMNLSLIAIILHVSFLSAAMEPFHIDGTLHDPMELAIKIIPLIAASIWMSANLKYEKNQEQYKKNTRVELMYCVAQACVFVIGHYSKLYLAGRVLMIIIAIVYIFIINPKYMNRQMTRKGDRS